MHEAFSKALEQLATDDKLPQLDPSNRRLLEAALTPTTAPASQLVPPTALEKLTYQARKLGRRWASYTSPDGQHSDVLNRLRDEWTVLRRQLARTPTQQRVAVLEPLVQGMNFDGGPADERKRHYLHTRMRAQPAIFASMGAIPGLMPPTPWTYVVDAIAELEAYSGEEQARLHAYIAQEAEARWPGRRPIPILELLDCWLTESGRDDDAAGSTAA